MLDLNSRRPQPRPDHTTQGGDSAEGLPVNEAAKGGCVTLSDDFHMRCYKIVECGIIEPHDWCVGCVPGLAAAAASYPVKQVEIWPQIDPSKGFVHLGGLVVRKDAKPRSAAAPRAQSYPPCRSAAFCRAGGRAHMRTQESVPGGGTRTATSTSQISATTPGGWLG
jgi:hypothetical protein